MSELTHRGLGHTGLKVTRMALGPATFGGQ